jgi:hypothetical protein
MTGRPPDARDAPEDLDRVMLAVLSNRGGPASPLSAEQKRLLDDWIAGRLPPDEAARAENLARQNPLAAEQVLERRLLDATRNDVPVPEALSSRVLANVAPPAALAPRPSWWKGLQLTWTGALGLAALVAILLIALVPVLQRAFQGNGAVQVALATITDRSPLFEPSDVRMRGGSPQPPAPADLRFRDVDVPTAVLRNLMKAANGTAATDAVRAMLPYLPAAAGGRGLPHIVIDAALEQKVDGATSERLPVRIYDLADPRAADIRKSLGSAADGRAWLLTFKP